MISKLIIFILISNLNFIANFPVENFEIDHNLTENESEEFNGNSRLDNSQIDTEVELIYDKKKIIKSKYYIC
jgi:hypothetical protein